MSTVQYVVLPESSKGLPGVATSTSAALKIHDIIEKSKHIDV